jgi:hypothetical protein
MAARFSALAVPSLRTGRLVFGDGATGRANSGNLPPD